MILTGYENIRHKILDGDLLLFRKSRFGFLSAAIATAGRGVHSHAGKAAWWRNNLFCLEVREFYGGRAVTLSSQVKKYPGRIDVFRPNADGQWRYYDPENSLEVMRRLAGSNYGYVNVKITALTHLPLIRWFVKPDKNDDNDHGRKRPPFCSQAVVMAERAAGVDPVPNLSDRFTEPSDLARSPFYKYLFTLE